MPILPVFSKRNEIMIATGTICSSIYFPSRCMKGSKQARLLFHYDSGWWRRFLHRTKARGWTKTFYFILPYCIHSTFSLDFMSRPVNRNSLFPTVNTAQSRTHASLFVSHYSSVARVIFSSAFYSQTFYPNALGLTKVPGDYQWWKTNQTVTQSVTIK